jgi:hypothetical protein
VTGRRIVRSLPWHQLTAEQVAWVLNCQPHDVPVLVTAKLLKPPGNLRPNSAKCYSDLEVFEQVKDRNSPAKVTNALNQHWQRKNATKENQPLYIGV